jgi:hypothetical protein
VAQTADTHDTNSLVGVHIVQSSKDSCASTLKRSGILIADLIRDRMKESLSKNSVSSKAALVGFSTTVENALLAENIISLQTLNTMAAVVGLVSPAYSISLLKISGSRASLLNNANTLVAQSSVSMFLLMIY